MLSWVILFIFPVISHRSPRANSWRSRTFGHLDFHEVRAGCMLRTRTSTSAEEVAFKLARLEVHVRKFPPSSPSRALWVSDVSWGPRPDRLQASSSRSPLVAVALVWGVRVSAGGSRQSRASNKYFENWGQLVAFGKTDIFEIESFPEIRVSVGSPGQKYMFANFPPRRRRPRCGCQMSAGGRGQTDSRQVHRAPPSSPSPLWGVRVSAWGLRHCSARNKHVEIWNHGPLYMSCSKLAEIGVFKMTYRFAGFRSPCILVSYRPRNHTFRAARRFRRRAISQDLSCG